jgi:hypothetical protein
MQDVKLGSWDPTQFLNMLSYLCPPTTRCRFWTRIEKLCFEYLTNIAGLYTVASPAERNRFSNIYNKTATKLGNAKLALE